MAEEKKLEAPDKIVKDKAVTEEPDKKGKPEKAPKEKFGIRVKKFLREYKSEIKKIVWPTREQVIKNTGTVLIVILILAAIVGALDAIFYLGLQLLGKI